VGRFSRLIFSRLIFSRDKLPERCIVFAGAYFPGRFKLARNLFDRRTRVSGMWVRYSFAKKSGKEFLLLFNVYGAAMMLEVLYLLKDGGAKSVFFVGSAGAKSLDVGEIILPTEVVDRAGVVQIDTRGKDSVVPPETESRTIEKALLDQGWSYAKTKVVSVPAVLHGIDHVTEYIRDEKDTEIHEMELSTIFSFLQKSRPVLLRSGVRLRQREAFDSNWREEHSVGPKGSAITHRQNRSGRACLTGFHSRSKIA